MKISKEISLWSLVRHEELWSKGQKYAERFTPSQLDTLEDFLNKVYPNGIDITTLNDLFRFDIEMAASWAGMSIQEFETKFWEVDDSEKWKWEEDESN